MLYGHNMEIRNARVEVVNYGTNVMANTLHDYFKAETKISAFFFVHSKSSPYLCTAKTFRRCHQTSTSREPRLSAPRTT